VSCEEVRYDASDPNALHCLIWPHPCVAVLLGRTGHRRTGLGDVAAYCSSDHASSGADYRYTCGAPGPRRVPEERPPWRLARRAH
jgi:hypothetical protein